MSDVQTVSSLPNRRRIQEIDSNIEFLTQEIQNFDDFEYKPQLECSLMAVKLKREKVKALMALAKSKTLLADMEVLIAESDIMVDLERLKNSKKKIMLTCDARKSQINESQEQAKSFKSVAVQTSQPSHKRKKTSHSASRTSPVDISSDDTIVIPLLESHRTSKTETLVTQFNLDSIKKSATPCSSDSEIYLSSSIRAEFEKPYNIETETSEKKTESEKSKKKSKGKSDKKNQSKNKHSSSQSSTSKPKTVAELKAKSVEEINKTIPTTSTRAEVKSSRHHSTDGNQIPSTSTFIPVRHNMPEIVLQNYGVYISKPHTTSHMGMQNSIAETNINYYNDQRNNKVLEKHPFYRNKQ